MVERIYGSIFVISALDGVGQLQDATSYTAVKIVLSTYLVGGWVGYRSGQDSEEQRKIDRPCRELNFSFSFLDL
jgi:hypothetical protein